MTMTAQDMNRLLTTIINKKVDDLHLTVGRPPTVRISGRLISLKSPPLTNEDVQTLMRAITNEQHQRKLQENGGTEFGFSFENKARFRVSIFRQRGNLGMVLRLISNDLRSLDEIGLPHNIKAILTKQKGIILVTGPTGSGKTSTLAAMVDYINTEMDRHILTIESPVEFYHDHKKGIVNQREVGIDVTSFSEAIHRGMNQDPDVIVIGEMGNFDTIAAALQAAETGHLVMGTVHTTGAANTISRVIDFFPSHEQEQIRTILASGLEAIVSQKLVPRADGKGRVAAFEIMLSTDAISHKIRENKIHTIDNDIQINSQKGMIKMDDCLYDMFVSGVITHTEAMKFAEDPDMLTKKIHESKTQAKR